MSDEGNDPVSGNMPDEVRRSMQARIAAMRSGESLTMEEVNENARKRIAEFEERRQQRRTI